MSNPLDTVVRGGAAIKAADEIARAFSGLLQFFKPFRPDVRVVNFDYLEKTWQAKFYLEIRRGLRRKTRRTVEIPAYLGATVEEVVEGEGLQPVKVAFDRVGQKWVIRADEFPESERFLVTLRGRASMAFFDEWIEVRSSTNPTGGTDTDKYWIHAALRNAKVLEKLHDEFNVDRVGSDVKVGVGRVFSTSLPPLFENRLKAQRDLLRAVESGDRNIRVVSLKYRRAVKESRVKPVDIASLISELTSGDYFRDFLELDHPFYLGSIGAEGEFQMLPERVRVQVYTRLSLANPAVDGYLTFQKRQYSDSITDKFAELLRKAKGRSRVE